MLLDGDGVISSTLDCGIVGNNHAKSSFDSSDSRNDSTSRHVLVAIKLMTGELRKLKERRLQKKSLVSPF